MPHGSSYAPSELKTRSWQEPHSLTVIRCLLFHPNFSSSSIALKYSNFWTSLSPLNDGAIIFQRNTKSISLTLYLCCFASTLRSPGNDMNSLAVLLVLLVYLFPTFAQVARFDVFTSTSTPFKQDQCSQ